MINTALENMLGYVKMPSVLSKLLQNHSNDKFGEFRSIIIGILESHRYEQNILFITNQLLEHDIYDANRSLLQKRRKGLSSHRTGKCIICSKSSDAADVFVIFNCGHNIHRGCIGQLRICPICTKEKDQRKKAKFGNVQDLEQMKLRLLDYWSNLERKGKSDSLPRVAVSKPLHATFINEEDPVKIGNRVPGSTPRVAEVRRKLNIPEIM
jgi:hypothetical protein